jgi:uncharacterized SAM-binding protein YcdF (DUF218 family)
MRALFGRHGLIRLIALGMLVGALIVIGLSVVIVRYGRADQAQPADVIIVLGGGEEGTIRRTRHAAALYAQGYAPYVLCTGNIVTGEPFSEAERCAITARDHGVPAEAIIEERISRSTEENAIQAAALMRARGWRTAVLVSDDFHLWRATWVFEQKGARVWPSPAQATTGPLPASEQTYAVLREVAATGWHVGKSLLGLPYTRVGD